MKATAALIYLLWAGLAAAQPPVKPAPPATAAAASSPGLALLAAAETAPLVVVGQVKSRQALDGSAYAVQLAVGKVLSGEPVEGELRVVWEELASGRAPRWNEGEWVIAALVEAPSGSLWRQRFPAQGPRWTIAAAGDAFLPDPDQRSVTLLGDFLAMPKSQRDRASGALALVAMVTRAAPPLGESALQRLSGFRRLPPDVAITADLMNVAFGSIRPPAMRRAIVLLAGRGQLVEVRPWLKAFIERGGELEAEAYAALAQLDGALPEKQVEMLLDRDSADLRAVGARFAGGDLAERRLPDLIRSDPAPEVRVTAVVVAVSSRTNWGLAAALPALADADTTVRAAAMQSIAALGAAAVASLESEVKGNTAAAPGAIAALSLMGEPGRAALRNIAATGADEKLRALAQLGLGEVKDEHSQ